ncbi:hypothetical protein F511_37893 [Dorcoceras hygrometricum]|uniref:Uncharacterized protein n=1 Tax=Dorcoceras hygrometricum TaxID=472368 RepID=A0A2Z7CQK7_9LAMI|nr:hypothetical protein F511_37893 [Dorcoceras hygrometricum]
MESPHQDGRNEVRRRSRAGRGRRESGGRERVSFANFGITDSAFKNQSIMVSIQYGPFNSNITTESTIIGKLRVARDSIAMHTSWRSNSDIACATRTQGTTLSEAFTTATHLCPMIRIAQEAISRAEAGSSEARACKRKERKKNKSAVRHKQRVVLVTSLHTHVAVDVQAGRVSMCDLVHRS